MHLIEVAARRTNPAMNCLERFRHSIKECLSRMIFFGEASLRNAVWHFLEHYNAERNHQGLDNRLIEPRATSALSTGPVKCRERLGGMLRYYRQPT